MNRAQSLLAERISSALESIYDASLGLNLVGRFFDFDEQDGERVQNNVLSRGQFHLASNCRTLTISDKVEIVVGGWFARDGQDRVELAFAPRLANLASPPLRLRQGLCHGGPCTDHGCHPPNDIAMNYRTLGRTGLSVSEISLGTWAFAGTVYGEITEADAIRTI